MSIADQERRLVHAPGAKVVYVVDQIGGHRVDGAHEAIRVFGGEDAPRHQGAQERNADEAVARQYGKRRGAVGLAAIEERPGAVQGRLAGVRRAVRQQPARLAGQRVKAVTLLGQGAGGNGAERPFEGIPFAVRHGAGANARPVVGEGEVAAGGGDFEFYLVVQFTAFGEPRQLVVDQLVGHAVIEVGGQERVEAEAHVDIRPAVEIDQQRRLDAAVSHDRPRLGPDPVGDQVLVKRQGQGPGRIADHLGRVPIGHLAEDGAPAGQFGVGRHAFVDGGADAVDGRVDHRIGDDPPAPPRRQGTDLEDGDLIVGGGAELDIQVLGAGDALDLHDGADQGRHARRFQRLGPRAVDQDRFAQGAAGDGVRAAAEIVVINHIVGAAGIQVTGQDDTRQHRSPRPWAGSGPGLRRRARGSSRRRRRWHGQGSGASASTSMRLRCAPA